MVTLDLIDSFADFAHLSRLSVMEERFLRDHYRKLVEMGMVVWDPTGTYSERKLDRTRAYKILVHAEIEFFIENILLDVVQREYRRWIISKSRIT